MLFALDYDGTYTEDPTLWDNFIEHARKRGHHVIVITMRYPLEGGVVKEQLENKVDNIIFTSRKAKKDYAERHLNKMPDVWIDDNPDWLYEDAL